VRSDQVQTGVIPVPDEFDAIAATVASCQLQILNLQECLRERTRQLETLRAGQGTNQLNSLPASEDAGLTPLHARVVRAIRMLNELSEMRGDGYMYYGLRQTVWDLLSTAHENAQLVRQARAFEADCRASLAHKDALVARLGTDLAQQETRARELEQRLSSALQSADANTCSTLAREKGELEARLNPERTVTSRQIQTLNDNLRKK
jgi:hypothetical protein